MDKNSETKIQISKASHLKTNELLNEEIASGIEIRDLNDLFAKSIPKINKGKLTRSESCI